MQSRRHRSSHLHGAVLEALEPRVLLSYTFASIASFQSSVSGSQPQGLVLDGAGYLFGVTATGGAKGYGTVFKIDTHTNQLTTLASFPGPAVASPNGGISPKGNLVIDNGNLYGTTVGGGEFGKGTVFEVAGIATAGTGSTITTVASFDGVNGSYPFMGLVVDTSGNFFGTSLGSSKKGFASTVWELPKDGDTITALVTFKSTDQLAGDLATDATGKLAVDSSHNIFGTTARGGAKGLGSVFQISLTSFTGTQHTFSTLASFDNTKSNTYGVDPTGTLLRQSDGSLVGTTASGGSSGDGTIFAAVPGTGSTYSIVTKAPFKGTSASGIHPLGTLIMDNGNLFGVTATGGSKGYGTVFELAAGTASTITTLHPFTTISNGVNPTGPLVLDAQGNFWGATYLGGAKSHNSGTIFELQNVPAEASQSPVAQAAPATDAGLHLVITQCPAHVGSGKAFTLVVKVEDAQGHVMTTVHSAVTLTLATGSVAGAFQGTRTLNFVKGGAKFMGLILRGQGTYSIEAKGLALAGALSGAITVT